MKSALQGRHWVKKTSSSAGTWHCVGQGLQRLLEHVAHIKIGSGVFTHWKTKYLHSFLQCLHLISYSSQVYNMLHPFTFLKPWGHFHMLFLHKYVKLIDSEMFCFWKPGYFNNLFILSVFVPEDFWHRNKKSANSTQK